MKSFIIRRVEKDEKGREGERFLSPLADYRGQHPDFPGWVTEAEALEALKVYLRALPGGGIDERKRYRFILVAVYVTRTDRDVREL